MVGVLEKLAGVTGSTTDETFDRITSILSAFGTVVNEEEKPEHTTELVLTQYRVDIGGKPKFYELWYQTLTPYSPEYMDCAFGFDEVAE